MFYSCSCTILILILETFHSMDVSMYSCIMYLYLEILWDDILYLVYRYIPNLHCINCSYVSIISLWLWTLYSRSKLINKTFIHVIQSEVTLEKRKLYLHCLYIFDVYVLYFFFIVILMLCKFFKKMLSKYSNIIG